MTPRFAASPSTAWDVFGVVDWTTLGVELTADVGIEVGLSMLHRSPWHTVGEQTAVPSG